MFDSNIQALTFQSLGIGFSVNYTDKFALYGGFRSGNSPARYTRLRYDIYFFNGTELEKESRGHVDLFVKDGSEFDVMGLVNIELKKKYRRNGFGREIIQSIMATTKNDLAVYDIKASAVGFWKKLGAVQTNGKGLERKANQNAIIEYSA